MVTSVVSNLSHSDYLNLLVNLDNKLSATKKIKAGAILSNKYGITYLPQLPPVIVASLALTLRHSDYQWLLTTNK